MSYYVGFPLIILAALIEVSVLPYFRVAGLQPNLLLVLLTAWLIVRGATEAFVLIPVGGLFLGLLDGAPLGAALLALAPLVLLNDLRNAQLSEGGLMLSILFTAIMTVAFNLIYLLVFTLWGQSGNWMTALTQVALPTIILNVLLLLPIYGVLRLSRSEPRRAAYV